jgi:hypothetical protein
VVGEEEGGRVEIGLGDHVLTLRGGAALDTVG